MGSVLRFLGLLMIKAKSNSPLQFGSAVSEDSTSLMPALAPIKRGRSTVKILSFFLYFESCHKFEMCDFKSKDYSKCN